MKKSVFSALVMILSLNAFCQDLSLYQKRWFVQNGDTMPYRLLLPENYDSSRQYPLVLFLHGRGESGTDNEKQLVHGARLFLADSNRKAFPCIVVFPQCNSNSYWSNVLADMEGSKSGQRSFYFVNGGEASSAMKLLMSLFDNLLLRYKVKASQVYVMGLSMGGMGTFELVRRKPGVFAAAVPICGGAHPASAAAMVKTKWWIFHGGKDNVVLPEFSVKMAEALKKAKAEVKFTLYPNANHNSWDPAFAEPGLLPWMFRQTK